MEYDYEPTEEEMEEAGAEEDTALILRTFRLILMLKTLQGVSRMRLRRP